MINKDIIDSVGKIWIGSIAVLGILIVFWKFIDKLTPILERQTEALETLVKIYSGGG